ncbi:MAG TPA: translocation/assembly module TamB domain-containing protein [Gammaproteobacteria bacterium]|nr:translocation/assembly module TamB domain-containing protein [Gammaproteobacteria bacterium]
MRWLHRTLAGLLALGTLGVAAVAALFWLLGTQGGTDWLLARARPRIEPAFQIGRVTGTLLGGLVIEDVRVRLTRDEVDFARLEVQWDMAAALLGVVGFDTAHVSPVEYRRLPPDPAARSSAPFSLPFTLEIDDATADGLTLHIADTTTAFGAAKLSFRMSGQILELRNVTTDVVGVALKGDGAVTIADPVHVETSAEWAGPALGLEGAAKFTIEGDWPTLRVHHELTAPYAVVADGSLDFTDRMRFDLTIGWQDLGIPNAEQYETPRGELKLAGTLDDYRYTGGGTLDVDGRAGDFTLAGTGAGALLDLQPLTAAVKTWDGAALGELEGRGRVALDARTADLDVAARNLDPRWLVDGWPGRLTGTAKLHATVEPLEAQFTAADLSGILRSYPVTIRGGATRSAPDRWQLAALTLTSGDANTFVLDGSIDSSALALDVRADLVQLGVLVPGASGALAGSVTFGGTFDAPTARGEISGRALDVAGVRFARLAVSGAAGLPSSTPLDLTIEADGVRRGAIEADSVRARLDGTTGAARIGAEASAADWTGKLAAAGGVDEAWVWRGTIDSLEINEMLLGGWRLEEPARASLGPRTAGLATSCLLHESGARWCAELTLDGKPDDRLVVSAQNFELRSLRPLLPPALELDGVYQLSASLLDLTGAPHGALAVTGGPTRARVAYGGEQAFATELDDFVAGVTLAESGRLELNANVRGAGTGRIGVEARIDDVRARDSSIGGNVGVRWPDLAFLALLSPDLGQVGGSLAVDLGVGGTVEEPTVEGSGAWNEGRVSIPGWGLTVEQIEATATSRDGRALQFDATGKVGDGTLTLTGSTALDPAAGWPTQLKLRGESVEAVQLTDAEIFVSPDLDVRVELPDIRVSGTVRVPHANVKLSELPAQALVPSPDTVVHGEQVITQARPLRLQTDVLLTLGDDVRYSGLNLATKVTGQLRMSQNADRSATATGTLTLAGTYNAYGQTLELERGQLAFSGPLDDPGLDVRAVRGIEGTGVGLEQTRVGVELTGTMKAPRTRVFSTPAMSEADALSYLLLGRPVSGSNGDETTTLQTAALSMGLQQALPVVQRIGQTIGLDELSVQTTDTDAGALMAGKNLSPRLYVRYSYGLFNKIGGLLVRFKMNDRFSLETRSGDQKSMDLLYTVEKD